MNDSSGELEKIIDDLRSDSAIKNKKGIAFISASVFVWAIILIINLLGVKPIIYMVWRGSTNADCCDHYKAVRDKTEQ